MGWTVDAKVESPSILRCILKGMDFTVRVPSSKFAEVYKCDILGKPCKMLVRSCDKLAPHGRNIVRSHFKLYKPSLKRLASLCSNH